MNHIVQELESKMWWIITRKMAFQNKTVSNAMRLLAKLQKGKRIVNFLKKHSLSKTKAQTAF